MGQRLEVTLDNSILLVIAFMIDCNYYYHLLIFWKWKTSDKSCIRNLIAVYDWISSSSITLNYNKNKCFELNQ